MIAVYRQRSSSHGILARQSDLDRAWSGVDPQKTIDVILYDGPDASRLGWTILSDDVQPNPGIMQAAELLAALYA